MSRDRDMSPTLDVTVAICTRNRHRLLMDTLSTIEEAATPPNLEWEVLVVDNGSTPSVASTVGRHSPRLPLRLVSEPTPGLSEARNRAVDAARGEYIVWIDDDVHVEENWLVAYWQAFRRWEGASFFGGPIVPRMRGSAPRWLRSVLPRIGSLYAARALGSEPLRFEDEDRELPYGANFAVRSALQREFRFDPGLGRRPGLEMAGYEEIDVFRRMLRAGHTGRWVPSARVYHVIPPERQTIGYIRRYVEADARHEEREWSETQARPRWKRLCELARRAISAEVGYRWHRAISPPRRWIEALLAASDARGRLKSQLSDFSRDR